MSESVSQESPCAGDLPAVVERMRPKLHALFYRFRLSPEDAEDVLQSALVQALVRWPQIRNKDAWLYVTVFRMCRGAWRSAWKRDVVPMDPQDLEWVGGAAAPPQERLERIADVARVCRSLSRRQEKVLILRHGHGLKAAEVAAEVGVQPCSVRKLAHRAMVQVRTALREEQAARTAAALREAQARAEGRAGGAASISSDVRRGKSFRRDRRVAKSAVRQRLPKPDPARREANAAAVFAVLLPVLPLLSGRARRALSFDLARPRRLLAPGAARPGGQARAVAPAAPPPSTLPGVVALAASPALANARAQAASPALGASAVLGTSLTLAASPALAALPADMALTGPLAASFAAGASPARRALPAPPTPLAPLASVAPLRPSAPFDPFASLDPIPTLAPRHALGPAPLPPTPPLPPLPPLPPDITWDAAVQAFLARFGEGTRSCYRRELARAGLGLGHPQLAALTPAALSTWRARLAADGRRPAAHAYGLSVLRSFLFWSGEAGGHPLSPEVVRAVLARPRRRRKA